MSPLGTVGSVAAIAFVLASPSQERWPCKAGAPVVVHKGDAVWSNAAKDHPFHFGMVVVPAWDNAGKQQGVRLVKLPASVLRVLCLNEDDVIFRVDGEQLLSPEVCLRIWDRIRTGELTAFSAVVHRQGRDVELSYIVKE
jgi:hypothetical protein